MMTKKEFQKLTRDYQKAFHEYDQYLEQFFTTHINGELIKKATKVYTEEEINRIDTLRKNFNKLENEWFSVMRSGEELTD